MASTATPVSRRASRETRLREPKSVSLTTGRDKKTGCPPSAARAPSTPSGSTPPGSGPFRNCGCRTACVGQDVKRISDAEATVRFSDASSRDEASERASRIDSDSARFPPSRFAEQTVSPSRGPPSFDRRFPREPQRRGITTGIRLPLDFLARIRSVRCGTPRAGRGEGDARALARGAEVPSGRRGGAVAARAAYHSSSASYASGGVSTPATFRALLISSPLLGRHCPSDAPSSTSMASSVASWSYLKAVRLRPARPIPAARARTTPKSRRRRRGATGGSPATPAGPPPSLSLSPSRSRSRRRRSRGRRRSESSAPRTPAARFFFRPSASALGVSHSPLPIPRRAPRLAATASPFSPQPSRPAPGPSRSSRAPRAGGVSFCAFLFATRLRFFFFFSETSSASSGLALRPVSTRRSRTAGPAAAGTWFEAYRSARPPATRRASRRRARATNTRRSAWT